MYEMAKKAREAMKGKARKLAGEKDQKVDSSDWSPAEPLNADVKTGMRPISRRAYKKGGKVEGACAPVNLGRKARKSGGKVTAKEMVEEKSEAKEYAKAKTNRDVKAANEDREGLKHIGGMKKGGRAKKMDGGTLDKMVDPAMRGRIEAGSKTPTEMPKNPPMPPRRPAEPVGGKGTAPVGLDKDQVERLEKGRKDGGKVATTLAGQKKIQQEQAAASKTHRGKARHYKKGGRAEKMMGGPMADPRLNIVKKNAMEFSGAQGSPYKKGGKAKKADGGLLAGLAGGIVPALAMGAMKKGDKEEEKKGGGRVARRAGGRTKAKGKTNINIVIAAGKPATPDMMQGPGGPPMPPPGVPVPLPGAPGGMPGGMPMGGAMGGMPMPPSMPAPPTMPGGPMGRKDGGRITKVAKSYKDMEAGSGGAEGRLQKTDIAKTGKGAPTYKTGGKVYRSYKDMDAGAGSGRGRLEKTEIEARKR